MRRTWLVSFSLPMLVSIPFSCFFLFQRRGNPFGFQSSFEPSRRVCRGYGRVEIKCAYYCSQQSNERYSSESSCGAGSGAGYSCSTRGSASNAAPCSSACYAASSGSASYAASIGSACYAASGDAARNATGNATGNAAPFQCCQFNRQPPERSLQL